MKNFEKYFGKVVYFIGIGGVSVSAIAKLCKNMGAKVLGSDAVKNEYTTSLEKMGVTIFYGHNKDNILPSYDLVVYTSAIDKNNVELLAAVKYKIPCIERGDFLAEISNCFLKTIAVSGTHGKTTTTSLISHILSSSHKSPSMHLGGISVNYKDNVLLGSGDYFVTEACEYKNNFKNISSSIAVVTNIEKEHMDYFSDMQDVIAAYQHFVSNADMLVTWQSPLTDSLKCKTTYTCGLDSSASFYVQDIVCEDAGFYFSVFHNGTILGKFHLPLIGLHNVYNATLAIAVTYLLGCKVPYIYSALHTFLGVARRYEHIGCVSNIPVILDYAHHPTEIASSIKGIKEHYKKELLVFQPHTFSRTNTLLIEFKTCFLGVNELIIFKTYKAREKYILGGSAKDLFSAVKNKNKHYISSKKALVEYINSLSLGAFDVVLVLGAGDIDKVFRKIVH